MSERQSWKRNIESGIISMGDSVIADVSMLFPEYNNFSKHKKDIILYGVQQRVSDKLAAVKDKGPIDYRRIYHTIVDGTFYEKKKTTRLTITKKAEAIKDTLSADNITLLKKLGILK